jgi:hypothetical protein
LAAVPRRSCDFRFCRSRSFDKNFQRPWECLLETPPTTTRPCLFTTHIMHHASWAKLITCGGQLSHPVVVFTNSCSCFWTTVLIVGYIMGGLKPALVRLTTAPHPVAVSVSQKRGPAATPLRDLTVTRSLLAAGVMTRRRGPSDHLWGDNCPI